MDEYLRLDQYGRTTAPEGKTLELKRDLSSPDSPLRTLVAFANSAGGRLVIGVADDGTIVGVDDPLAEEERVASLINDRISPQLVPAIDLVTLTMYRSALAALTTSPARVRKPASTCGSVRPHGRRTRHSSPSSNAMPAASPSKTCASHAPH